MSFKKWNIKTGVEKDKVAVVYSLGNFISNQREVNRDGGLMVNITILKRDNLVTVLQPSYYLSWVHKFRNKKGNNYQILPCFLYEKNKLEISKKSQSKMTRFIKKSRALFKKENISFVEQLN